jgi:signal peptidase II
MKQQYLILLSILGFLITTDQLSKNLSQHYTVSDEPITIIGNVLKIYPVKNKGLIYNLFARTPASIQDSIYIGIPMLALILIVLIFLKLKNDEKMATLALTFILGGAAGNILDRLQFGAVIDFIQVFGFSFNLADIYLFVGILLMTISTLKNSKPQTA